MVELQCPAHTCTKGYIGHFAIGLNLGDYAVQRKLGRGEVSVGVEQALGISFSTALEPLLMTGYRTLSFYLSEGCQYSGCFVRQAESSWS